MGYRKFLKTESFQQSQVWIWLFLNLFSPFHQFLIWNLDDIYGLVTRDLGSKKQDFSKAEKSCRTDSEANGIQSYRNFEINCPKPRNIILQNLLKLKVKMNLILNLSCSPLKRTKFSGAFGDPRRNFSIKTEKFSGITKLQDLFWLPSKSNMLTGCEKFWTQLIWADSETQISSPGFIRLIPGSNKKS